MSKADSLRVHEVRAVYRLLGDCRDLGYDPGLWQPRLMEGLGQLLGLRASCGGEGMYVGPEHRMTVISVASSENGKGECAFSRRWAREVGPSECPIFRAMSRHSHRGLTRRRTDIVTDRQWYRSRSFLCRADSAFDHQLTSIMPLSTGSAFSVLVSHQDRGCRDFTPRQQQLLHFLHSEIGMLIGQALVSATEPGPDKLSPRLRQTLVCLLEGDSEKQVAARLQLSRATIHQYVTALYRHFSVKSRAELLALVIRRMPRAAWMRALRDVGSPRN